MCDSRQPANGADSPSSPGVTTNTDPRPPTPPERYQPELGQWAFGAPTGEYAVSNLGSAAIASLLDEMRRVFWNRQGQKIDYRSEDDAETWNAYDSGIEWHAYWWGDDEAEEASRPNLTFSEVEIRWYKWPGRGESSSHAMLPQEWHEWLDRALQAARSADVDVLRDASEATR